METSTIALVEAIFLTFLNALGIMSGCLLKPKLDFPFLLFTSYTIGLAICLSISLLIIILPIHLQVSTLFGVLIILFIGLLIFLIYKIKFSANEVQLTIGYLITFSCLAWLFSYFNFMVASDDSLKMMRLGEILSFSGGLDSTMTILGNWGIALPVFQAIANMIGIKSFTALFPLLLVPMFFGFARGGWLTLVSLGSSKLYTLVATTLGAIFLCSAVFIQWNAFYYNAHLASGIYLLLFIITLLLASIKENSNWMFFSSLFLIAFCFWRTEGIALATIFCFLLLPAMKISSRAKFFTALFVTVPVMVWYLYLYIFYAPAGKFLNEKMLIMIAAMMLVTFFIYLAPRFSPLKTLLSYGSYFIILISSLALLFVVLLEPHHMAISFNSILGNTLLGYGWWKMEWLIVIPLLIVSQSINKPLPLNGQLLALFIFFSLFLLEISYLRQPYRLSHWDSANRILVHIFPSCVYYIVLKFGASTSTLVSSEKKIYHR